MFINKLGNTAAAVAPSEVQAASTLNISIAPPDDAARLGSSCLKTMEDRQILLEVLKQLGFDALEELSDFTQFYDTIDFAVILHELLANYFVHTRKAQP